MAFNGSGVFNRLYNWANDKAAGIKIRADRMDNEMNGFATGLSTCITKDGQTTVTANLPMAGHKHTNVASATSRTEYAALSQVQDGVINWATAGGTADAITANYSPAITALVDGQICFVRASGANTVTNPTFAPNGLTARTIVKNGNQALNIGDIAGANYEMALRYNLAGTRWELLNPKAVADGGTLSSIRAATSAGILLENNSGGDVLLLGAGGGLGATFGGGVNLTGALSIAGQASGAAYITLGEDTDNGTNTAKIIAPETLGADITITLPSETCTIPVVTPWVAYTPTFTGFGTVTNIEFFSRRNGSSLEVMGKFTPGTKTATEARISFGFNGTDSNVTSDSTVVPSIRVCGNVVQNGNNAAIVYCLIEGGVSYVTFGAQSTTSASLTKQTGTGTGVGSIGIGAVQFSIPITGW